MFDTLGPDTLEYILNQTELQTVVCSNVETPKLIAVASKCPHLRAIVQSQHVTPSQRETVIPFLPFYCIIE